MAVFHIFLSSEMDMIELGILQVKKGLFMMFNGRTQAKNLQLFMDVSLLPH